MQTTFTRDDVAAKLGIGASRVSQIASLLKIRARWNGTRFVYNERQLERMKQRNRKPGPQPKNGRRVG